MLRNVAIPVHHELVFAHGAYVITDVSPVYGFADGKRGEQAVDPESGELVWAVTVTDADPELQGPAKSVKVKLIAKHQPVPPANLPGLPEGLIMRPVEFEGLTVKPYVTEVMAGRFKIAYSLVARGMASPAPAVAASNGGAVRRADPVTA